MTVDAEKLLRMAEQIAANMNYTEDQAVVAAKVADHLTRFWDPRMKDALRSYVQQNATAASPLLLSAIDQVR